MATVKKNEDPEYLVAHGRVLIDATDQRGVGATVKQSEVGADAAAAMVEAGTLTPKPKPAAEETASK